MISLEEYKTIEKRIITVIKKIGAMHDINITSCRFSKVEDDWVFTGVKFNDNDTAHATMPYMPIMRECFFADPDDGTTEFTIPAILDRIPEVAERYINKMNDAFDAEFKKQKAALERTP